MSRTELYANRLFVLFMSYWDMQLTNKGLKDAVFEEPKKEQKAIFLFKSDITNFKTMLPTSDSFPQIWEGIVKVNPELQIYYYFNEELCSYPTVILSFIDGRDITSWRQVEESWEKHKKNTN